MSSHWLGQRICHASLRHVRSEVTAESLGLKKQPGLSFVNNERLATQAYGATGFSVMPRKSSSQFFKLGSALNTATLVSWGSVIVPSLTCR
ncbi:hypothetical protein Pla52o_53520 [Novipirellula galeiformis]|uniref:Uncharacterized protein n=1 Tax=Novipirellula galeiformis TaxID=2528004 RepID=A0A5C6BZQ1_9BACT|nr:hypothetical protein Pla52o_53520 [Novipirellula galeiformis]